MKTSECGRRPGQQEITWMRQVCLNWAIAVALALGFGATGWLAAGNPAHDPAGVPQRAAASSAVASFLIHGTNSYSLEALAKAHGWTVTGRLKRINAIVVSAPPEQVREIATRWPGVTCVKPAHSEDTAREAPPTSCDAADHFPFS